jgi:hypothetical protein
MHRLGWGLGVMVAEQPLAPPLHRRPPPPSMRWLSLLPPTSY